MAVVDIPEGTTCTYCGSTDLRIEVRLVAREVGGFSLAGAQMKFSTSEWPWMVCGGCGHESKGQPA